MNGLLSKIKKLDLVFLSEVFILTMFIIVPSIVTFFSKYGQAFSIIIPILLLYVPFFALMFIFDKKRVPSTLSVTVFLCFLIYFLITYLLHKYYDIYSDKEFGVFSIFNGYSSFFAILFFSIKYKSKSLIYSLKISIFVVLAISILSLLVSSTQELVHHVLQNHLVLYVVSILHHGKCGILSLPDFWLLSSLI